MPTPPITKAHAQPHTASCAAPVPPITSNPAAQHHFTNFTEVNYKKTQTATTRLKRPPDTGHRPPLTGWACAPPIRPPISGKPSSRAKVSGNGWKWHAKINFPMPHPPLLCRQQHTRTAATLAHLPATNATAIPTYNAALRPSATGPVLSATRRTRRKSDRRNHVPATSAAAESIRKPFPLPQPNYAQRAFLPQKLPVPASLPHHRYPTVATGVQYPLTKPPSRRQ